MPVTNAVFIIQIQEITQIGRGISRIGLNNEVLPRALGKFYPLNPHFPPGRDASSRANTILYADTTRFVTRGTRERKIARPPRIEADLAVSGGSEIIVTMRYQEEEGRCFLRHTD